jgi:hypothetical protein
MKTACLTCTDVRQCPLEFNRKGRLSMVVRSRPESSIGLAVILAVRDQRALRLTDRCSPFRNRKANSLSAAVCHGLSRALLYDEESSTSDH